MKPYLAFAGILLFAGLAGGAPDETPVSGRIRVIGRPGRVTVSTIVYAEPLGVHARTVARRAKLAQKDKAFVPHVLAVPAGSTIDFPNEDRIFHNIFSLSPPAPFDLGLYRAGRSKNRVFDAPATYQVFCNIHPQMAAVILVLPTDYITEADASLSYRLELPPGRYRITAWSERSQPASAEISVGGAAFQAPDLTLDESKFVEMPHKNKLGQDYPKNVYEPIPP